MPSTMETIAIIAVVVVALGIAGCSLVDRLWIPLEGTLQTLQMGRFYLGGLAFLQDHS